MLDIQQIEKSLIERESVLDELIRKNREIVRLTANSIKEMHANNLPQAKKLLAQAESEITRLEKEAKKHGMDLNHIMQEYAEARFLECAIERKELPSSKELGITEEAYLNGLLDAIGEFKRQMYESLRKGDRHAAEYYFGLMDSVYDSLLPLKFSNALLPEFRRKQDIARMQVEQARGELL